MNDTVPTGYHVTYAEDPVFPGDFFADLRRDVDGAVIESGGGTTREAARSSLLERYGRKAAGLPAPAPEGGRKAVQATIEGMLSALVNAGYYASFTKDPEGYVASVSRAEPGDGDGYQHDAIGDTLNTALRAALPDGIEARDPDPGDRIPQLEGYVDILIRTVERLTRPDAGLPAPTLATDVATLSAEMTDVHERLDRLEAPGEE